MADIENFGSFHMYARRNDPNTPQNELQEDIDRTKAAKPSGQPLVVDEVFNLATRGDASDVRQFVLNTRPEAAGWIGHYFEQTPAELTPPPDFATAIHVEFYRMFLALAPTINTRGTGALQP